MGQMYSGVVPEIVRPWKDRCKTLEAENTKLREELTEARNHNLNNILNHTQRAQDLQERLVIAEHNAMSAQSKYERLLIDKPVRRHRGRKG